MNFHISRPNVAHVVIVITDGRSQKFLLTQTEAEALKKTGAYVFAIGRCTVLYTKKNLFRQAFLFLRFFFPFDGVIICTL